MSSVKRRKVDGNVPSGLLKKKSKKHTNGEIAPVSKSASPEPIIEDAPESALELSQPQATAEEEPTKTFKDLVS